MSRFLRQLVAFSPNARYYLLSIVVIALGYSIYMLLFNLYIDSSGYSRAFLGELQSMPALVSILGTLPVATLVDRLGRKRALLLGAVADLAAVTGLVLAPGPTFLRLAMILHGLANTVWMVSSAPFMMENSTEEERDALFSASFGLQTLVGFAGTLVGGYLPSLFGRLLGVGYESPTAYRAALAVIVGLFALALLPLLRISRPPQPAAPRPRRSWRPWDNLSDRRLAFRIFLPNIVISLGAAILIPYMNLFFKETFAIGDNLLGMVFAISSVVTGLATLTAPLLASRWGRIRALTGTQLLSVPFLLLIGFSPVLWLSGLAFWVRAALMNMANPLYTAFAMAQIPEEERATVSGLMGMSWNIGWTVGPYLSGAMQQNPAIGFRPIFVITCTFYLAAAALTRRFFQRLDDRQRTAARMAELGVGYLPYERA